MATLLLFVPVVIFLFLDHLPPFAASYPLDLKLRLIPSFLVVFAYAYIYETLRESDKRVLEENNKKLERKFQQRTEDLRTAFELAAREVDVRKRVEQKLEKSHKSLLTILESMDAVVYAADIKTSEILFMNQYARTQFNDGVGRKCWQVFQKDQTGVCPFCPDMELIDEKGNFISYSWERQSARNGRWYDMRDCAANWLDGTIARIQIATDITERKMAEEKVLKAKKEWETTFDALTEQVFILDTDFTIMRANKAVAKGLGLDLERIIGRKCHEVMHEEGKPPGACPFAKMLKEGGSQCAELFLNKLSGDFFVSVSPIIDEQGVVQGGVHVVIDISERKKAEAEKKQTD